MQAFARYPYAVPVLVFSEDRELSGFFVTRRVSEGRKREDVASDVTPSLAYASGCDCYEKRNFKKGGGLLSTPAVSPYRVS
jgi:hypothetical protein